MKVLVTGAGGFIGSYLSEILVEEGHDVRAFIHYNSNNNSYNLDFLDRQALESIEIVPGDITDPHSVDRAVKGCDVVFHLAALIGIPYSYHAPGAYVSTNVTGTLNILESCRRHEVKRILHTSTSEVYGTAQYVPIDESHPIVGQSPYSATKIAADKLAESFWLSFGLPVTIVRPFNTYGPRQSMRAIIPTIIAQALSRDELNLGSLSPIRDITFVTDTVRGFITASHSIAAIGETVNLGVGMGVSVGDLVAHISRLLGKSLSVNEDKSRVRPEKSEIMRLVSNNAKAKSMMGWEPLVDLDSGLLQVIEFMQANLKHYKVNKYVV